ncbi:hypothetical protein [Pseudomonas citronellolis]|uniref:hypothetical protein n=1 Tax=Pseudomonas citronellolis TaxID=53408 RepID=UPI00248D72C7|nr:hypothetical protein [Pseudomonas citronellolis]
MKGKSSTQTILEAVRELHSQQKVVTRDALHELTGLKPGIIDDRLSALVDDMLIGRIERGVYVPLPDFEPPRAITVTQVPGGKCKVEVNGDDYVLELTPAEKRLLGEMLAGAAQGYARIALEEQNQVLLGEMTLKLRRLEKEVKALRAARGALETPQLALVLGGAS